MRSYVKDLDAVWRHDSISVSSAFGHICARLIRLRTIDHLPFNRRHAVSVVMHNRSALLVPPPYSAAVGHLYSLPRRLVVRGRTVGQAISLIVGLTVGLARGGKSAR